MPDNECVEVAGSNRGTVDGAVVAQRDCNGRRRAPGSAAVQVALLITLLLLVICRLSACLCFALLDNQGVQSAAY